MKLFAKLKNLAQLRRKVPRDDALPALIHKWFQTPLGKQVLAAEKSLAEPIIERLFGYHILQMGGDSEHSLIANSPAGNKIQFAPAWRPGSRTPVADNEELPLAADSIDVVIIHHALDFTEDSHRLLREATRVLRPGGQMLIIGFNPVGYWGLWKLFRRRSRIPWCGRFISKRRLADWLKLLNLHIEQLSHGLHFPPLSLAALLRRADKLERLGIRTGNPFGGVYIYLCVKQVVPITPIVPRWRPFTARPAVIPATENAQLGNVQFGSVPIGNAPVEAGQSESYWVDADWIESNWAKRARAKSAPVTIH